MKTKGARTRLLALLRLARQRSGARRPRPRGPGPAAEPAPVEPPRSPTLSGGAAAAIEP